MGNKIKFSDVEKFNGMQLPVSKEGFVQIPPELIEFYQMDKFPSFEIIIENGLVTMKQIKEEG